MGLETADGNKMTRMLIGIFVILHGLAHAGLAAAPVPREASSPPGSFFTSVTRSWLFRRLNLPAGAVRLAGLTLVILSTAGFVLAGLAALGVPFVAGRVAILIVPSALLSLALIALFWHPWLIAGCVIDFAVLLLWVGRRF